MTKTCPLCGKPEREEFRPFCSKRCADLDLGKWLKGAYRIPGREKPPEDQDRDEDEET